MVASCSCRYRLVGVRWGAWSFISSSNSTILVGAVMVPLVHSTCLPDGICSGGSCFDCSSPRAVTRRFATLDSIWFPCDTTGTHTGHHEKVRSIVPLIVATYQCLCCFTGAKGLILLNLIPLGFKGGFRYSLFSKEVLRGFPLFGKKKKFE
jgi:hypothetical protein